MLQSQQANPAGSSGLNKYTDIFMQKVIKTLGISCLVEICLLVIILWIFLRRTQLSNLYQQHAGCNTYQTTDYVLDSSIFLQDVILSNTANMFSNTSATSDQSLGQLSTLY